MMDHSTQLFALFARIEKLGPFSAEDIRALFELAWSETDNSNLPYFSVAIGECDKGAYRELISRVEVRVPGPEGEARLLNLKFEKNVRLTRGDVTEKYKAVELRPASATAPIEVPDLLIVKRPWGQMVFGLSRDGRNEIRSMSFQRDEKPRVQP